MRNVVRRRRQQGAVLITVAMLLLLLLGFMGIAVDFGHLFIVKTELQTAVDSCALAAANELDGKAGAVTRAQSAGKSAGNLNGVNFQSNTWSGQPKIVDAEITFRAADYSVTTADTAKYAQCQHTQSAVPIWLLRAMGALTGDTATFPSSQNVAAYAVATLTNAQTICPVPLALKPKPGGTAPDYGYVAGEWVSMLSAPPIPQGKAGWATLDPPPNAAKTKAELSGICGITVGSPVAASGVEASVADPWNSRFGIYKGSGDPSVDTPDFTGYAYTWDPTKPAGSQGNWPTTVSPSGAVIGNAYQGATPVGADPTAANFVTKRQQFASCDDTGTRVGGANSCESITRLSLNGFSKLATPGPTATGGHKQYGANRRIVIVPVTTDTAVLDFSCMLLLQPLSIPMSDMNLEYLGNAAAAGSPCAALGVAGGSTGPLVPVLVR